MRIKSREIIDKGESFIVVKQGNYVLYNCYFSTNRKLVEFKFLLDKLEVIVRNVVIIFLYYVEI